MAALVRELGQRRFILRATDATEIAGFLAWVIRCGAIDTTLVHDCGLAFGPTPFVGPIGALLASGTPPGDEWVSQRGETAEETINRVRPPELRGLMLPGLATLLPGGFPV
jgi:hypothetical protein